MRVLLRGGTNHFKKVDCPQGGPPAGLLGRGRDTPAGEDIERNKGGPVRLRNLAAVQHRCIHLLQSNQCANSKTLITARSKLFCVRAQNGFISLFFNAFLIPISFSLVLFSRILQGAKENYSDNETN